MDYRNEYEIRVWGMSRSGNHTIIDWIAGLFDEPVYFFNAISTRARLFGRKDPFRTEWDANNYIIKGDSRLKKIYVSLECMKSWNEKDIQPIRFKHKKCIIYSHEICLLHLFKVKNDSIRSRKYTVGNSEKKYDVLIIRDLYNWWASLLLIHTKNPKRGNNPEYIKKLGIRELKQWCACCKEFLGETSYLPFKENHILYNKWFTDKGYRIRTAGKFDLPYSEDYMDIVAYLGSSFDQFKYQDRAREMDVFNRWKSITDGKYKDLYLSVIDNNPEAVELNRKIFGDSYGP